VPPSSMDERLLLDLSSFQKLLEAAWVLQNYRSQPRQVASPPLTAGALDFLSPVVGITASDSVRAYEAATANATTPLASLTIPIATTLPGPPQLNEPASALAFMDTRPAPFSPSSSPAKIPVVEQPIMNTHEISNTVTRSLVPRSSSRLTYPKSSAITIRFTPRTRAAVAPATVLLIILVFLASYLLGHRPSLTPVKAAFQAVGTAIEGTRTSVVEARSKPAPAAAIAEPPRPETSHLRVTAFESESIVEDLSRFEMQTVRRQAQFGDNDAALTLGLAYEVGSQVPQSCTQAAHWISLAAEQGNAAAEYNLALRYLYGDGTKASASEARKWLQKAARQGNQEATTALKEGI
jgi:hypothetical protein